MTEDTIKSHHYPTPKRLRNILKPDTSGVAARWHDLGTQLLTDDTVGVLDVIKVDHPSDASACCNKMFVKWLELQPNATWSQLIIALGNIGMRSAAEDVIKCLLKDEQSETTDFVKNKIDTTVSSNMIFTPEQASIEFGILLANILKELSKNEVENLDLIKVVCSYLTVKGDPSALLFNEEQREEIDACGNIRTLFKKNLRHCLRWDDFSLLKTIVESLDSPHCVKLIDQFEKKLYSRMKLKEIHEQCEQESKGLPEGYHKMVAIVTKKSFLHITLEEYRELKEFILQHCKVEPYALSPFMNILPGSLLLEWLIPSTAVSHMIEMATTNANVFITQNFIFLKISSTVILDTRHKERRVLQLFKAAKFGYVGVVKTLINNKYIDVNSRDNDDDKLTPLHYASMKGHVSIVEVLIRSNADVNGVNEHKMTPLHYAASGGHSSVAEVLIRSHADINAISVGKMTPLHVAATTGHLSVVEVLIRSHADINAIDNMKRTPLHFAANKDHSSVVEVLVRSHADINAVDISKSTPLHHATREGHSSVVEVLIRSHTDINAVDVNKRTPLYRAAEKGHLSIVEILIRSHADINTVDVVSQCIATDVL